MNDSIKRILILIVAFVIGGLVGYYSMPEKVNIKTETIEKVVEKIVEKIVEVKVTDSNTNTKKNTVIIEEKKPDGTIITKTEIKDVIEEKNHTEEKKEESKSIIKESEKIAKSETIKENFSKWKVNLMYGAVKEGSLSPFNDPRQVGVGLEYRILGPVFVGGYGFLNKNAGLSLGLNF